MPLLPLLFFPAPPSAAAVVVVVPAPADPVAAGSFENLDFVVELSFENLLVFPLPPLLVFFEPLSFALEAASIPRRCVPNLRVKDSAHVGPLMSYLK